jgi:hypothetical protein
MPQERQRVHQRVEVDGEENRLPVGLVQMVQDMLEGHD